MLVHIILPGNQHIFFLAVFNPFQEAKLINKQINFAFSVFPVVGKKVRIKALFPQHFGTNGGLPGLIVYFQDSTILLKLFIHPEKKGSSFAMVLLIMISTFAILIAEFLVYSPADFTVAGKTFSLIGVFHKTNLKINPHMIRILIV